MAIYVISRIEIATTFCFCYLFQEIANWQFL